MCKTEVVFSHSPTSLKPKGFMEQEAKTQPAVHQFPGYLLQSMYLRLKLGDTGIP